MSAQFDGAKCNLNKNDSVYHLVGFKDEQEDEQVIRECLIPFPHIWASVHRPQLLIHA